MSLFSKCMFLYLSANFDFLNPALFCTSTLKVDPRVHSNFFFV